MNRIHDIEAIGAYTYSAELAAIDSPDSATYVPYPDASMSCEVVGMYLSVIHSYITFYAGELSKAISTLIPSRAKVSNLQKIVANLKNKKSLLVAAQNTCSTEAELNPEIIEEGVIEDPGSPGAPAGSGGSMGLWLLIGAGGLYLLMKKRGGKK